jgi:hypothetical protein
MQFVEHFGDWREDDSPGLCAGLVGEGTGQKGFAPAGIANEDGVDAPIEEWSCPGLVDGCLVGYAAI